MDFQAELIEQLRALDSGDDRYAIEFIQHLLTGGRLLGTSDIHLQPVSHGVDIRWRHDGVLQALGVFPNGRSTSLIARLKVLANLLTYRTEVPQEGRLREGHESVEMRVSTFPTLYGERAVVRVFARAGTHQELDQLGLPPDLAQRLRALLSETSGALVISGPVGSGKSTTAYACLRELVRSTHGGRSICSLEDPIESVVDGVSQSQVNPASDFTLLTGLKSLLRQDPEVMMIGEIRDAATAEVCLQASLTGQLVVTTFHAGNAAEAVGRLLDMGIEPYVLRSGILAVLNQRLMRRLCDCAVISGESGERWGMHLRKMPRQAAGCANCYGTGYRGRLLLAEWMEIKHGPLGDAIASRQNVRSLQQQAVRAGMAPLWSRAVDAVEQGWTSPEEVCRVLGLHRNNYGDDPITRDSAEP